MVIKQLGLIGCGLIGGSVALALKRTNCIGKVVGYSKILAETKNANALGVIDIVADSPLMAAVNSDVVLLAVPVTATELILQSIKDVITPSMLIMDVGSTKGNVAQVVNRVLGDKVINFVPAHPIAGKEVSGVVHAHADLFEACNVILTPSEKTGREQLKKAEEIWKITGAKVHQMSPNEHDVIFAAVSHLPHLLAYSYMQGLLEQNLREKFLTFAGSSFRDFTRIAASDPVMWRDIFLTNKEEILKQCQSFQKALDSLEKYLQNDDGKNIEAMLNEVNQVRSVWRN